AMDLATGRQQVKLQGDQLNLDRYLPPAVEESQTTDASPATAGERYPKTPLLPLEVLRGLNFDVQLGLGELIASGLRLSELKLAAKANSGLIEVSQIDGKLYGGGFSNSATLDVRQEPIRSVVQKRVTSIQLGGLLKDLADVDKVAGTFSTEGRYTTHGNSIHAMVNSLTGSGTIRLKNGQLKGVNLVDSLCEGIRQVKGLPESDGTSPDYTEFSNLSATLAITNGVVSNDDLAASMVAMGLTGRGKVNLPASEFDYGLDLTVLQQLQGEKCQIEEKLHNLAFPVRCKGSFDDEPAKLCGPDTKRMKQVVKDLFKRDAGDKVKQKLDEKLKDNDKVKSVLQGLFN
ncbi:MAG TPA: AsmA family protein, partial [Motiliproteus sp.]